MRGAQLLAEAMKQSSVDTVFSLSGNQIMPLYDACIEPKIRLVHTRHEAAAVFMADAYAQVSGKVGVSLVTAAPGFANALGALYSATMAESPVIFLSGDSPTTLDGQRAFQEFPQVAAASVFVKHSQRVTKAARLADAWNSAVDCALSGTQGPVHLALPFDVLNEDVLSEELSAAGGQISGATAGSGAGVDRADFESEISVIVNSVGAAARPLVITGPMLNEYRSLGALESLRETFQLPVVCMESPRGLSDPAQGRLRELVKQADCIVLLGKKPDFTLGFASTAVTSAKEFIVVDPDARSLQASAGIIGDRCRATLQKTASEVLHELLQRSASSQSGSCVPSEPRAQWLTTAEQLLQTEFTPPAGIVAASTESTENPPLDSPVELHPSGFLSALQSKLQQYENVVLVCDGGEFGQWAQACLSSNCRVINGTSGAIGGSLPYAIGASLARPDAIVIAVLGDGTAGFHLAEFETAFRENSAFVAIIGNDSCWNAEHQIQLRDYGKDRTHSCELGQSVRYDVAAIGLGARGSLVTTEQEFSEAVDAAILAGTEERATTCINVIMQGLPAPVFS